MDLEVISNEEMAHKLGGRLVLLPDALMINKNIELYSDEERTQMRKKIEKSRTGYLLNMNEALYLGSMFFKNRLN